DPTADAVGYHPPPLPGLRKFAPPNAEVILSVILSAMYYRMSEIDRIQRDLAQPKTPTLDE
ncbi:MAG: hypothetical protein ACREJB_16370, partial [Planctomycetaceae bacterium]